MPFPSLPELFFKRRSKEFEKSNSTVTDSLFMELEYQIKKIEYQQRNRLKEEKLKKASANYKWLMTSNLKPYKLSQSDREDLKGYFKQIQQSERQRVIILFRNGLILEKDPKNLINTMKFSIEQVLRERPKEEIIGVRQHKYLWKLMNFMPSARVTPTISKAELNQSKSCASLRI
ncbi:unnamed protein product [Dimorphilus gyrociliatus]|uniref:Uncharacterized protein n=1 Tax=Dimorphilus gyrociliatus TaxID=2664684 RepID=A0A7I8W1N6_9ANNE|nr:unnamed protein product [Dimorphilus gyrociliatus]